MDTPGVDRYRERLNSFDWRLRVTSLLVRGGGALNGHIKPSANKNAVLPILCATLLTEAPITLRNVPDITDVRRLVEIFRELGSSVDWDTDTQVMQLEHRSLHAGVTARSPEAMRAAVLLVPLRPGWLVPAPRRAPVPRRALVPVSRRDPVPRRAPVPPQSAPLPVVRPLVPTRSLAGSRQSPQLRAPPPFLLMLPQARLRREAQS